MVFRGTWVLALGVWLGACGTIAVDSGKCELGATQACTCTNGATGAQICESTALAGPAFSACSCQGVDTDAGGDVAETADAADATDTPSGCSADTECLGVVTTNGCQVAVCSNGECVATSDLSKDGQACQGDDLCLQDSVCSAGACTAGTPKVCPPSADSCVLTVCEPTTGACVVSQLDDGDGCDDGDSCTVTDTCTGGTCAGTAMDCSGLDTPCATGTCADGACSAVVAIAGTACVAADPCVIDASCSDLGACEGTFDIANAACDCSDPGDCPSTGCTTAVCNSDGTCGSTINADTCSIDGACYAQGDGSPGDACQICDTATAQDSWSALLCDDGNACTTDSCDASSGCVVVDDDTAVCDDGDPCSPDDHCDAGVCVGTCECLIDSDCDQSVAPACQKMVCTNLSCQPVTDTTLDATSCDDGDPCSLVDTCTAGVCSGYCECNVDSDCGPTAAAQCQKAVCTGYLCEVVADPAADGADCDDSDPCTLVDTCTSGVCGGTCECTQDSDCTGTVPQCKKAVCTNYQCEQVPDTNLDGTSCNDSDPCTLVDTCTAGTCGGTCECAQDSDCDQGPAGLCQRVACNGFQCEVVADAGKEGQSCDDGDPCIASTCAAGSCVQCADITDCAAGETCNAGKCVNSACTGVTSFNFSDTIESFVAPSCARRITIQAWGAQGGAGTGSLPVEGGLGAYAAGSICVPQAGITLQILTGEKGHPGGYPGGGGGGSFVATAGDEAVVVAGAGGGGYQGNQGGHSSAVSSSGPGLGGGTYTDGGGGGGGGFTFDGLGGIAGGKSFKNGGAGGTADPSNPNLGDGGFGGGGASTQGPGFYSGGGGGYDGGRGWNGGGSTGGSSFFGAMCFATTHTGANRVGDGLVTISW